MKSRQQKRIKDTALMLRNVLNMCSNMSVINLNYAADLKSFVSKLKNLSSPESDSPEFISEQSQSQALILKDPQNSADSKSREEEESSEENIDPANRPPQTKKPPKPWVKDLYRKIMMKCHPDRNQNEKVDIMEQVYRSEALVIAVNSYKEEKFDDLIYAGALVDIYSSRIPANKQIELLNKSYNLNSKIISEIQNSISWSWGINWETHEYRINLIHRICSLNNIEVPPKEKLISLLNEHDEVN